MIKNDRELQNMSAAGQAPLPDEYTPEQRQAIDARLKEAKDGPFHGPFKDGHAVAAFLKAMTKASDRKSKTGR